MDQVKFQTMLSIIRPMGHNRLVFVRKWLQDNYKALRFSGINPVGLREEAIERFIKEFGP